MVISQVDEEGKPTFVHGLSISLDGGEAVRRDFDVTIAATVIVPLSTILP